MITQIVDKIYKIELPLAFPFSFKATNVYFIDEHPRTLVDTGIHTEVSFEVLKNGLETIGLSLNSIERILITHGHTDHYGQAQILSSLSGAQIYIHPDEYRRIRSTTYFNSLFESQLLKNGVPEDLVSEGLCHFRSTLKVADPLGETLSLRDGDIVPFESMKWQTIQCPGHSPALLCFYWKEGKILFTTDHLLKDSIPPALNFPEFNPSVRYSSLRQYLTSLEKIKSLDISLLLPGHGEEIRDVKGLIQMTFAYCQNRKKNILSLLSGKVRTPYEVATDLFSGYSSFRISFAKTPEVVGHLEILKKEGMVRLEKKGGRDYYSLL